HDLPFSDPRVCGVLLRGGAHLHSPLRLKLLGEAYCLLLQLQETRTSQLLLLSDDRLDGFGANVRATGRSLPPVPRRGVSADAGMPCSGTRVARGLAEALYQLGVFFECQVVSGHVPVNTTLAEGVRARGPGRHAQ